MVFGKRELISLNFKNLCENLKLIFNPIGLEWGIEARIITSEIILWVGNVKTYEF